MAGDAYNDGEFDGRVGCDRSALKEDGMDVSIPVGPARLWPGIDAIPRRWSLPLSPRTIRVLVSLAVYMAFVLLMHGIISVLPHHAAAAGDTYLCKRH